MGLSESKIDGGLSSLLGFFVGDPVQDLALLTVVLIEVNVFPHNLRAVQLVSLPAEGLGPSALLERGITDVGNCGLYLELLWIICNVESPS